MHHALRILVEPNLSLQPLVALAASARLRRAKDADDFCQGLHWPRSQPLNWKAPRGPTNTLEQMNVPKEIGTGQRGRRPCLEEDLLSRFVKRFPHDASACFESHDGHGQQSAERRGACGFVQAP